MCAFRLLVYENLDSQPLHDLVLVSWVTSVEIVFGNLVMLLISIFTSSVVCTSCLDVSSCSKRTFWMGQN